MTLDEYRKRFSADDAAPGWDAIDERLHVVYGDQKPQHWGTIIKHMLGGKDPLDGISAYACAETPDPHLHFVTYGYSSLYLDEQAVGGDFSRYGFEMTFRLGGQAATGDVIWVCSLLQNIARYVFSSQKWFESYHWIPAGGPIKQGDPTQITGLVFLTDPVLGAIDTPHGKVEFIQAIGVTDAEIAAIKEKKVSCQSVIENLQRIDRFLVTNLERKNG